MSGEAKRDNRGGPRIVLSYGDIAQWRCLLCGAAVIHVDDHYDWHLITDRILLSLVVESDLE